MNNIGTTSLGELLRRKLDTEAKAAKPYHFKVTSNVSRATFYAIYNAPASTRQEITRALVNGGHKEKSVSSIITQLLRQGLIRSEPTGLGGSYLYPVARDYSPLSARKQRALAEPQRKKIVIRRKPAAQPVDTGIAALPASATAPMIQPSWDAQTLIDHMSLRQARALYDELHKIFGGK